MKGSTMANEDEDRLRDDDTQRKRHYGAGKQPWDTIKELGWAAEFAASNVLKYMRRVKDREHSVESARWYYARLKEMMGRDNGSDVRRAADVYRALMGELTDGELALLVS